MTSSLDPQRLDPRRLDPQRYYRLPWSLADNAISWLEVTNSCNLACAGCYRSKEGGHKTLDEISEDLAVFKRERKSDCMSIAGGDPLVHPQIPRIVRMVKEGGWKPIINTNGLGLTPKLLSELKREGAFGFTFHVDTSQTRRDSRVAVESEHNPLREKFADMVASAGNLSCSFNQTVTSATLDQVPEVVRWARKNPRTVNTVVFILYREPRLYGSFQFHARGNPISLTGTYEETESPRWGGDRLLKAADVVEQIRKADPLFEPSAYLNGTEDATSFKWLIGSRICDEEETFGYVTPRFMEWAQQGNRMLYGKWLSYSSPKWLHAGRSALAGAGLIDPGMRKLTARYLKRALTRPGKLLNQAYLQTFAIIQPIDVLADGRMNMCDGCPDMTVYKGKMYWSCRLEEIKNYGAFATATPLKTDAHPFPDRGKRGVNAEVPARDKEAREGEAEPSQKAFEAIS